MPENLTQEQFNQVIAEIQKISDQGGVIKSEMGAIKENRMYGRQQF
jgi:methylmalonyl-CoA mutase N-terminal domain/subunit